ncbi:placenta-expressed transcript 1 protein-like [Hyperolius riggenbachi]|uniref:placenta-expressed transcript 1 protein-like n=1 Tax=Hyperolius riggenbachi TaxID=752182 RepID=UPI0035A2E2D2
MTLTGCTAVLLLLGVITTGYAADLPQCDFPNNTASSDIYTLSIFPEILYNDTVYTVKINGSGSVKVLFQSLSNNTAVGTWSQNGTNNCAGGPLFNVTMNANKSLVANWTSPSDQLPAFVDIKVSITDGNVTNILRKKLYAGSANAGSAFQPLSTCFAVIQSLGLLVLTRNLL